MLNIGKWYNIKLQGDNIKIQVDNHYDMKLKHPQNFSLDLSSDAQFEFPQNRKFMPKFVLKEMETLYIEEMNAAIATLKSNLESILRYLFTFKLQPMNDLKQIL